MELEPDTSASGPVGLKAAGTIILVGHNVNESPANLIDELRLRYICPSQKAVSTAVLNAFEA